MNIARVAASFASDRGERITRREPAAPERDAFGFMETHMQSTTWNSIARLAALMAAGSLAASSYQAVAATSDTDAPVQVAAALSPAPAAAASPAGAFPAHEAGVRAAAIAGPDELRRYIQRTR